MTTIAAVPPSSPPFALPTRSAPWRRWAALLTITLAAPFAQAGVAEYKLLNTRLNGGVATTVDLVSTASSQDLANAVIAVIQANPRINAGTIAGEALRRAGSNAPDAGAQIANAVITTFPTGIPFGTKSLTLPAFATQAIKTTSTGAGLTVAQVPGFSAPFVSSNGDAINLAVSVKASARAAGAVLAGRAQELPNDSEKQALANSALGTTTLASAVLDVAAGIASTVQDPVAFTNALINPANAAPAINVKNVLKIVPGIAAGQPTSAGAIVEASFVAFDAQAALSPIVKGAALLAKSVGAVADIEQIEEVGVTIAKRVGTNIIKLSAFTAIATTLSKAIVAKPLAIVGANRNANKVDELGEFAAYSVAALLNNVDFAKAPEKALATIIKAIVTGSKSTYGPSQTDVASYVLGSIALTISNLSGTNPLKARLTAYLQNPATAKALVGTALAGIAAAAITDGLAGAPGRFENGFDAVAGGLVDAETNSRNL